MVFGYCGYVYDTESRLYYLQSRYYDPKIGRFINADSLASTGQGILGYNMFAYCGNNPVSNKDASGRSQTAAIQESTNWVLALLALLDGATPVFEIAALLMAIGIVIAANNSDSKKEEKVIADATTVEPESSDTVIYRYYASRDENLAPRMGKDYDGLSFSTKPPRPGVKAVATTINTVNATGILVAIPTSSSHVLVIPKDGDVLTWMALGQASIWTQVLSMIVIEIEG